MAFSIESTSSSGALTAVTGATFAHTVTSANKILVTIGVGDSTQADRVPSGVTWNTSVNLTSVDIQHETSGNSFETAAIWEKHSPGAATANIVVTMTGTCEQLACGVTGFIDSDTSLGTPSKTQGTTADGSVTVTDSVSGDIVVSVIASDFGGSTLTPGGTQLWENENVASDSNFGAQHQTASGASTVCSWTEAATFGGWAIVGVAVKTGIPIDQSAFRWGDDDGSESAHGWDQAENTNTTDTDNQTKLLRVQVEATGDPAAIAYTLRYQKNGSGGYVAVPVGVSSDVVDSPATDSGTLSGNNTATSSWTTVAVPAYASGSLVIIGIAWDDSTTTTDVTEPAGPNSETILEVNATPETDSSTETRCKVWYYISTDSYAGGNFTFTPSATESWQAVSYAIPSGEFDGTTPIGATNTNNGATGSTDLQHGSFSAGASDGGGRLFCFASADADPQTVASGFTQVGNNDIGAVSGGLYSRDTVVSDSESFSATTFATITGDSFASVSFVVRPYVQNNECYVNTSANIAAGGEDTTARLSVPGGKSFTTGRRWDDENGTDTIDIGDSFYSEFEWAVALSSAPVDTDYFEFRVYSGASALTAYDYTPRWTVGSGGGGGTVTHLIGSSLLNSRLTRSILN